MIQKLTTEHNIAIHWMRPIVNKDLGMHNRVLMILAAVASNGKELSDRISA
jgi:hypothetical protein